ncbi:hypothetical protein EDC17_103018 [Sphingobacterium alimentarium]|uniref:Uncharacterized protein n=1 Tax=Sphingobacterium alimentarium TaxID=797292 RepID=A0A4R3VYB9_9SPHI|nr:hypothetical protein EDC17_103018 [Sphingobacterium alimentarium]
MINNHKFSAYRLVQQTKHYSNAHKNKLINAFKEF